MADTVISVIETTQVVDCGNPIRLFTFVNDGAGSVFYMERDTSVTVVGTGAEIGHLGPSVDPGVRPAGSTQDDTGLRDRRKNLDQPPLNGHQARLVLPTVVAHPVVGDDQPEVSHGPSVLAAGPGCKWPRDTCGCTSPLQVRPWRRSGRFSGLCPGEAPGFRPGGLLPKGP